MGWIDGLAQQLVGAIASGIGSLWAGRRRRQQALRFVRELPPEWRWRLLAWRRSGAQPFEAEPFDPMVAALVRQGALIDLGTSGRSYAFLGHWYRMPTIIWDALEHELSQEHP